VSWSWSERHIDEYHRQGYTVFAAIVPATLIGDLRRACDEARALARECSGPQVQRLQPVFGFEIDHAPFTSFADLPELVDAVQSTLSTLHTYGHRDGLGVLLEPAESAWCTAWHRDFRDNMGGLDLDRWEADFRDADLFNQLNCALYEDSSTWVVPGSHLRADLPREAARFPERPIAGPVLEGLSEAAREHACRQYCASLPGAVPLQLAAGDFCLYRNTLWHIGSYVPYRKRATLHDFVDTTAYHDWREREGSAANQRREAGAGMTNPNRVA
jgi:hypothetical protein